MYHLLLFRNEKAVSEYLPKNGKIHSKQQIYFLSLIYLYLLINESNTNCIWIPGVLIILLNKLKGNKCACVDRGAHFKVKLHPIFSQGKLKQLYAGKYSQYKWEFSSPICWCFLLKVSFLVSSVSKK